MLVKPITYTDYNGNIQTENFHFHISKSELVEKNLEQLENNVYLDKIREIAEAGDIRKVYENFKWIILGSYGRRTEDGRRFQKTEELTRDFEQSAAYETLYEEMLVNAEAAAAFVNEVFPKDMDAFADRVQQNAQRVKGQMPGTAQDTLTKLGVSDEVKAAFPAPPPPAPTV